MKSVRVRIHGKVQGVWFRGWTVEQAGQFGLSGWVRNRRDGTVEAVFFGDDQPVESMLALCRRGPPAALVTKVEVTPDAQPDQPGFGQMPTL
ncbi:MAG: acylphosphatase [Alphaproteobacteria bacterium]|nr:acylphosphatase [Alphaproteobacteria bacterium]